MLGGSAPNRPANATRRLARTCPVAGHHRGRSRMMGHAVDQRSPPPDVAGTTGPMTSEQRSPHRACSPRPLHQSAGICAAPVSTQQRPRSRRGHRPTGRFKSGLGRTTWPPYSTSEHAHNRRQRAILLLGIPTQWSSLVPRVGDGDARVGEVVDVACGEQRAVAPADRGDLGVSRADRSTRSFLTFLAVISVSLGNGDVDIDGGRALRTTSRRRILFP